jgi:Protein of unknown function with HXXEE motif
MTITHWLKLYWVAASLCMSLLLLMLAPVFDLRGDLFLLLIYLHTPAYMLHQVEEHTGDRFREFVNQRMFHGLEALTGTTVLVINLPGVWGVTILSLYAAVFIAPGWGLPAVYLVAVNALIHIAGAAASRAYNPGLWTALARFLPLSALSFWQSGLNSAIDWRYHAFGLTLALAIHAAIIVHVRARARSLSGA